MEVVRCLYREYADNPLVFDVTPEWLQSAIDDKLVTPDFRTEDYWYYVVNTASGPKDATPGDLIVRRADLTLDVYTRKGAQ